MINPLECAKLALTVVFSTNTKVVRDALMDAPNVTQEVLAKHAKLDISGSQIRILLKKAIQQQLIIIMPEEMVDVQDVLMTTHSLVILLD